MEDVAAIRVLYLSLFCFFAHAATDHLSEVLVVMTAAITAFLSLSSFFYAVVSAVVADVTEDAAAATEAVEDVTEVVAAAAEAAAKAHLPAGAYSPRIFIFIGHILFQRILDRLL